MTDPQQPEHAQLDRENHWHLDRKVPIALIIGLALQAMIGIWFAGKVAQRQDDYERRLQLIEAQNVSSRLGVLESQVNDVKDGIKRIEGAIARLVDGRIKDN